MIVSWIYAKHRLAANSRPSFVAAWGLVGVDFVAIMGLLALLWQPLMQVLYAMQPGDGMTILILFVVFFVPIQAVIITSSLWAAKSRWEDKPGKGEDA